MRKFPRTTTFATIARLMTTALDIENPQHLTDYLRQQGHIGSTETPRCTMLAGGVSNRTVLVERETGEQWVVKQALAKLRVKVDWFSDPARIHREAQGLRSLESLAPPGTITPLVFDDTENHILAMQAVPQPHDNWKTMLLAGKLQADHVRQFAELLGTIHRKAYERAGEMADLFADRQYFESLRLEPYFGYAAEQAPDAATFLHQLIDDTRSRQITIVHGDYSPKNVLVHNDKLILLDHEVIHFGDPAFDLGFSMTHLLSKAHHLPTRRQAFVNGTNNYWQIYRQTLGSAPWADELEPIAVRQTLGCLLARVAGRSTLEYLSEAERNRQKRVVVSLCQSPPSTVISLIEQFVERLERHATD